MVVANKVDLLDEEAMNGQNEKLGNVLSQVLNEYTVLIQDRMIIG